jgi:hypothetical protein
MLRIDSRSRFQHQSIHRNCLDRLPLPQNLKQLRGTVYQTKSKGDAKERALWLATNRASLSPKPSELVRAEAPKRAESE